MLMKEQSGLTEEAEKPWQPAANSREDSLSACALTGYVLFISGHRDHSQQNPGLVKGPSLPLQEPQF